MKILVGLGNPGAEYHGTRHNLGFEVVELVAARLKVRLKEGRGPARSVRTHRGGDDVLLVCPSTYMNLSGEALLRLDPSRTAEPSSILVVCDDLALSPGRLRLRAGGSDGGHKGLRSVEQQLGTNHFPRLRIGVGAAAPGKDVADYVLERPTKTERDLLDRAVAEAVHGLVAWLDSTPLATLMNRLNRDPEPPMGGPGHGDAGRARREPPEAP